MADLSPTERHVMEHALGRQYPARQRDYRNRFCAEPGGEDDATWRGLCERGLARLRAGPNDWQVYNVYAVTDAGKAALDG
jgi:hypothetical protein